MLGMCILGQRRHSTSIYIGKPETGWTMACADHTAVAVVHLIVDSYCVLQPQRPLGHVMAVAL